MSDLTSLISEFSDQFTLTETEVINKLTTSSGWDGKYREIMLLGKSLKQFTPELRTDEALVSGCESSVWLHHLWQDGKLYLAASSDSKIVRGLLSIVLAKFIGKTREQIQQIEIDIYFKELGLSRHLSPSRSNGINAIVNKIKSL
jgi:cysteine desulfuration protein SufE